MVTIGGLGSQTPSLIMSQWNETASVLEQVGDPPDLPIDLPPGPLARSHSSSCRRLRQSLGPIVTSLARLSS